MEDNAFRRAFERTSGFEKIRKKRVLGVTLAPPRPHEPSTALCHEKFGDVPGVHERANKGITKGSVRCRGVGRCGIKTKASPKVWGVEGVEAWAGQVEA